jgi:hypothetical protein
MQHSARLAEPRLHRLRFAVVDGQAVPLTDFQPADEMTLDQLATYIKGELENSDIAGKQAILQAHKSAVHLFRAGRALHAARQQCQEQGHGVWKEWKEQHNLAHTTVNDAIRLFENAKIEDALIGLGITEAKKRYVYTDKQEGAGHGKKSKAAWQANLKQKKNMNSIAKTQPAQADDFNVYEPDGQDQGEQTDKEGDDDSSSSADGEAPTTLASEIKQMAQRLSEIAQDEGGKVDWSGESIDDVEIAVRAVEKYAGDLLRWLGNQKAVADKLSPEHESR